jgi:hypothetical protein
MKAVADWDINQTEFTGDWHAWFCSISGKREESCAGPTTEDNCENVICHNFISIQSRRSISPAFNAAQTERF